MLMHQRQTLKAVAGSEATVSDGIPVQHSVSLPIEHAIIADVTRHQVVCGRSLTPAILLVVQERQVDAKSCHMGVKIANSLLLVQLLWVNAKPLSKHFHHCGGGVESCHFF